MYGCMHGCVYVCNYSGCMVHEWKDTFQTPFIDCTPKLFDEVKIKSDRGAKARRCQDKGWWVSVYKSVTVCNSVYQCVQCQGRESKNEIYREKGESWQLCQQLINLWVCLYQRGATHTTLQLIIIRLCSQSVLLLLVVFEELGEGKVSRLTESRGTEAAHFLLFLSEQSLNAGNCKCWQLYENLHLKSCALKMILIQPLDPDWGPGDIFEYIQRAFDFNQGEEFHPVEAS